MPDIQTLVTGLVFPEQPRWHKERLWFSPHCLQDVPVQRDLFG